MSAQVFQFSDYKSRDLLRRMDELHREAFHLYEASLVLVMTAVELQMVLLGVRLK